MDCWCKQSLKVRDVNVITEIRKSFNLISVYQKGCPPPPLCALFRSLLTSFPKMITTEKHEKESVNILGIITANWKKGR